MTSKYVVSFIKDKGKIVFFLKNCIKNFVSGESD